MPEIFGKQVSKGTIAIGIGSAGLLGIAVYRYRKQQAADAATAAANAAAQAPGTGAGTSDQVDPATGFPYGSAQDAAALTAQAGYNSPIGGLGYSDPQYMNYGYGLPNNYPSAPGGYTSNAAWSQAVEQYMVGIQGGDANAIGNALGKYITGQPLDSAGQALVHQAIAFEGYPPVAGPNGFPPSINTANPGSTGSNGSGSGTEPATVVVPKVIGMTGRDAFAALRSEALNPGPGGLNASYIVTWQSVPAGRTVPKHTAVTVKVKKP